MVTLDCILAKTIGNFTESISPLPTRFELKSEMKEDRSKGIDGHNPSDERRYQLEKETLEKYNVDSLSQLPINFSGILFWLMKNMEIRYGTNILVMYIQY